MNRMIKYCGKDTELSIEKTRPKLTRTDDLKKGMCFKKLNKMIYQETNLCPFSIEFQEK